jgi:hypothetical protein
MSKSRKNSAKNVGTAHHPSKSNPSVNNIPLSDTAKTITKSTNTSLSTTTTLTNVTPPNSFKPTTMKLDSRSFSKEAHRGLTELKEILQKELSSNNYDSKACNLVRGLTAYISTWGLHRLSGDARKFLAGTPSDTKYKGYVYQQFLVKLKIFSGANFDVDDESTLINLPLSRYTGLNRLAIELSKEWSFWAVAVLGEPSND